MRATTWAAIAAMALLVTLSACARARKVRPAPPPFRPPAKVVAPAPEFLLTEEPPLLSLAANLPAPLLQLEVPRLPAPTKPKLAVPVPGPKATAPVPETLPELRPLLRPEEAAKLDRQIQQRLERARRLANVAGSRPLTTSQRSMLKQVFSFIDQAEKLRSTDPKRANNLAERAEVLAEDLLRQLGR